MSRSLLVIADDPGVLDVVSRFFQRKGISRSTLHVKIKEYGLETVGRR